MAVTGTPRLLVCASQLDGLAELRRQLAPVCPQVGEYLLDWPEPDDLAAHDLVILESGPNAADALNVCRRFRQRLGTGPVAILFLLDDPSPGARRAALEAGADAYLLRPFAAEELLAQARALLHLKDLHDRLAERTQELQRVNKRLQETYQQIDQELELAERLQSRCLPETLPQVPHARFAVHYLLCGQVGGDFYDAFRLDEHHVAFYVADAMGYDVPASLLAFLVKTGLRAKEIVGQQYRLVPPEEVLHRLNKDLIGRRLSDGPFLTMVYGLFNHTQGTIRIARAGHPSPLHIPADGAVTLWRQEGLLLGVADAQYPAQTYTLKPGDKLLFYSDGIDNASFQGYAAGTDSFVACAGQHRALPLGLFLERMVHDLFGGAVQPDNCTLLGLEMTP